MFRIYDGRFEFYQWDLDRKILVADPAITEVHFCNKTDSCSLVTEVYELEGKRVADVPNVLLQENWDIRVYGYCGDCYTRASARFKVVGRTKPADYVYTETEVKRWEALESKCEEMLKRAEDLAKGATAGQSFMDYEALVAELNTAAQDKYFCPQHFLIKTLNVPDVWVYEVKEESVQYEYVDDQTFAQGITDGLIQVGYFVLSALETQKVNLTNYYTKEETDSGFVVKDKEKETWLAGQTTVYASKYDSNGYPKQDTVYVTANPISGRVPRWSGRTTLLTNEPQEDLDCVNKKYIEDNFIAVPATDEQKALACETIGAVSKATDKSGYIRVYGASASTNNPVMISVQLPSYDFTEASKNSRTGLAQYKAGNLGCAIPLEDYHTANKKYVDDLIAALEERLTKGGL